MRRACRAIDRIGTWRGRRRRRWRAPDKYYAKIRLVDDRDKSDPVLCKGEGYVEKKLPRVDTVREGGYWSRQPGPGWRNEYDGGARRHQDRLPGAVDGSISHRRQIRADRRTDGGRR